MGKYMRKSKTTGEVALMEVTPSSLGVRTRAKTLALQHLQKLAVAPPSAAETSGASYLELRSRRLEKPPIFTTNGESKRQKHLSKESCAPNPNPNSRASSRIAVSLDCSKKKEGRVKTEKEVGKEEEIQNNIEECVEAIIEASFGENVLEFEGRERGTRETTPCSLIRDPETIRTPGSTTRPTSSTEAEKRVQNSMRRNIPTTIEMEEFFLGAEKQHQRQFIEKYNYDPVRDMPLLGRYEWVKMNP